jgi:WXG100 family type VII secretion target
MADEIRADYDQLADVANRFAQQAELIAQMTQKVQGGFDKLHDGGWMGRGASAFFAEMGDEIFPACKRLFEVLNDANQTTKDIIQVMQQAEEEAAGPFRAG